jgi:outer membrane protein assembly factor BamB
VVAGNTIVHAVGKTLRATDPETGQPRWEIDGTGRPERAPVVISDTVYWLTRPDDRERDAIFTLLAVDLDSGQERWRREARGSVPVNTSSAIAGTGDVVVTTRPLRAVRPSDGGVVWQAPPHFEGYAQPSTSEDGRTLYAGLVDVARNQIGIAAIDPATGMERWFVGLMPDIVSAFERPWRSGDLVLVPRASGAITALDAASGAERWTWRGPQQRTGAIAVERGLVWFSEQSGSVLALDARSGALVARSSAFEIKQEHMLSILTLPTLAFPPVIVDGMLVAPVGTRLFGFYLPPALASE